jgi:lysozyme
MPMSRRQFLGAAAGGTAVLGAGAYALADDPPTSYPVQGIDVSKWQGTINWNEVATAGKHFCFVKATEGVPGANFEQNREATDPRFAFNWAEVKRIGMARGAYHMVRPSMGTPREQADHFLDTINPTTGDLRPVLDMEKSDGLTPAQVWRFFQLMVARIKSRIGRAPIVYTGFFFWRDNVGNPLSNLDCPLWFARWSYPIPPSQFPRSWTHWTFWQYTDQGVIPGITANTVDLNAFYGSLADLDKFKLP